MKIREGNWILTHTHQKYWPIDPRPSEVNIQDIAHALSNICRYTGHTKEFYSVAQHSVLVASMVPEEYQLVALLHDATEAYCQDISRPLKPFLTNYQEIEDRNWRAISTAFSIGYLEGIPQVVKDADTAVCAPEMKRLMDYDLIPRENFTEKQEAVYISLMNPRPPKEAFHAFMATFNRLWGKKMAGLFPAAISPIR